MSGPDDEFVEVSSTTIVSARKEEKRQNAKEAKRNEEILDHWKTVMSTLAGREVIAEILDMTAMFQNSFTGTSETFFNEGRRSVGLDIMGRVGQTSPESLAKLITEAVKT